MARSVHGLWYDYSQTVYKGSVVRVTIIRLKHGAFEQIPDNPAWIGIMLTLET
jgi:hypothetical protein